MTSLAPLIEAFFLERLKEQRDASAHTVDAYRHTFRLLLIYAQSQLGKPPSKLKLRDLDAPLVARFLAHLEKDRGNSVRTRNARLAAIHSFFAFVAQREPSCSGLIQRVLTSPSKRADRALVTFLNRLEIEALLAAPDRTTWHGRRDHALLLVALQTGLRVSELLGLRVQDVNLNGQPSVRCFGKGRKERCTPLTRQAVSTVRNWLREQSLTPEMPLFPGSTHRKLSRDAAEAIVKKHVAKAREACPSLTSKRVTPHVLRHTAAMALREANVDCSVIALWLGHESIETTQVYLHADLAIKEKALARIAPQKTPWVRFRATDDLIAFLEGERIMPKP